MGRDRAFSEVDRKWAGDDQDTDSEYSSSDEEDLEQGQIRPEQKQNQNQAQQQQEQQNYAPQQGQQSRGQPPEPGSTASSTSSQVLNGKTRKQNGEPQKRRVRRRRKPTKLQRYLLYLMGIFGAMFAALVVVAFVMMIYQKAGPWPEPGFAIYDLTGSNVVAFSLFHLYATYAAFVLWALLMPVTFVFLVERCSIKKMYERSKIQQVLLVGLPSLIFAAIGSILFVLSREAWDGEEKVPSRFWAAQVCFGSLACVAFVIFVVGVYCGKVFGYLVLIPIANFHLWVHPHHARQPDHPKFPKHPHRRNPPPLPKEPPPED